MDAGEQRPAGPDPRLEELRREHHPDAVRGRLGGEPERSHVRDFVFGAVDGTVTTFAVVAGVEGAGLSPAIVVVLGLANLLGDGFSMAASNYLAVRAEEELRERKRTVELEHIRLFPEGEREEVRQIFARKGFAGEELAAVVDRITSDVERWVETMLQEEYGLARHGPSPLRAAWITFVSFVLVGALPLLAFLPSVLTRGALALERPFAWSAALAGCAFFVVGALKARFVERPWWTSGLQTATLGGCAAAIAYAVGALLRGWTS